MKTPPLLKGFYIGVLATAGMMVLFGVLLSMALSVPQRGSAWVCFGVSSVGLFLGFLAGRQAYRREMGMRRMRAGLCVNCGYDIRASSERCPECGWVIAHDDHENLLT